MTSPRMIHFSQTVPLRLIEQEGRGFTTHDVPHLTASIQKLRSTIHGPDCGNLKMKHAISLFLIVMFLNSLTFVDTHGIALHILRTVPEGTPERIVGRTAKGESVTLMIQEKPIFNTMAKCCSPDSGRPGSGGGRERDRLSGSSRSPLCDSKVKIAGETSCI